MHRSPPYCDVITGNSAGEGGQFGERYQVTSHIGHGSTAEVFEARHFAPGAPVAIKRLRVRDELADESARRRFAEEASLTARLTHPNTVRVFDFGQTEEGGTFLVMERLVGDTLNEVLQRETASGNTLDEDFVLEIAAGVLGMVAKPILDEKYGFHKAFDSDRGEPTDADARDELAAVVQALGERVDGQRRAA